MSNHSSRQHSNILKVKNLERKAFIEIPTEKITIGDVTFTIRGLTKIEKDRIDYKCIKKEINQKTGEIKLLDADPNEARILRILKCVRKNGKPLTRQEIEGIETEDGKIKVLAGWVLEMLDKKIIELSDLTPEEKKGFGVALTATRSETPKPQSG